MRTFLRLDADGFVVEQMTTSDSDSIPGWELFSGSGNPVRRTEHGEWVFIKPRPNENYRFCKNACDWVLDTATAWASVRTERDKLLANTDWRLLRAAETQTPVDDAWLTYRQELRDITNQPDPFNVVWPEPPKQFG